MLRSTTHLSATQFPIGDAEWLGADLTYCSISDVSIPSGVWSMPIVGVPPEELDSIEYERMVPGCRVEYRGTFWKVIGMYFAPSSTGPTTESGAASNPRRTKFLVLRALTLSPDDLPPLVSSKSS